MHTCVFSPMCTYTHMNIYIHIHKTSQTRKIIPFSSLHDFLFIKHHSNIYLRYKYRVLILSIFMWTDVYRTFIPLTWLHLWGCTQVLVGSKEALSECVKSRCSSKWAGIIIAMGIVMSRTNTSDHRNGKVFPLGWRFKGMAKPPLVRV